MAVKYTGFVMLQSYLLIGIPNFELEDPADSFDMEMAREHLEECDLKKVFLRLTKLKGVFTNFDWVILNVHVCIAIS